MFAYCCNAPIINYDSNGHRNKVVDTLRSSMSGGGADWFSLGFSALFTGIVASIDYLQKVVTNSISKAKVLSAVRRREKNQEDYTVYFLKDAASTSNSIVYVGRVKTANLGPRMAYHETKGREFAYCISGLDYTACRFLEQAGMIHHHTINRNNSKNNKIRGISIANGYRFLGDVIEFIAAANYIDNEYRPFSYIANQYENWLLNG